MSMIFLKCYKPKACSLLNGQYVTCAKYPLIVRWARSNRHDLISLNVCGNTWNRDAPAVTAMRPTECRPSRVKMPIKIAPEPMDLTICALVYPGYKSPPSNTGATFLSHHSIAFQANGDWTFLYTLNFDWMLIHILDWWKRNFMQMQNNSSIYY